MFTDHFQFSFFSVVARGEDGLYRLKEVEFFVRSFTHAMDILWTPGVWRTVALGGGSVV